MPVNAPRRFLSILAAGGFAACGTVANAAVIEPVDDLRISIGVLAGGKAKERVSENGSTKAFDWERGSYLRHPAMRTEVGWWQARDSARLDSWHGMWTARLSYTHQDITPTGYTIGGVTTDNGRPDLKLGFDQYGVAFGYGIATTPHDTDLGDVHYELLPLLRGGYATSDTTSTGANPEIVRGHGLWWEAALETAVVVQSDSWVVDLHGGAGYGRYHAKTDMPNNGTSALTIITLAPEIGLSVGWRF